MQSARQECLKNRKPEEECPGLDRRSDEHWKPQRYFCNLDTFAPQARAPPRSAFAARVPLPHPFHPLRSLSVARCPLQVSFAGDMSLVRDHSRMLLQNRSLWDDYGKDGWQVFGRLDR